MRESTIERHLVQRVRKCGGEAFKIQFLGRSGAPDRLVMFPDGEIVWVELKAPGKKAKPHQSRMHVLLRELQQSVEVLDSIEGIDRAFPLQ
jgi:hypothetical protein